MDAIQFIKEHGVDKAREVVEGAPDGATHLSDDTSHYVNTDFKPLPTHIKEQLPELVDLSDLKRLVESVDFINKFGGIDLAKAYDKQMSDHGFDPFFDKAIADYESIYSDNDMGDGTHIENHISKNCKVIDYD